MLHNPHPDPVSELNDLRRIVDTLVLENKRQWYRFPDAVPPVLPDYMGDNRPPPTTTSTTTAPGTPGCYLVTVPSFTASGVPTYTFPGLSYVASFESSDPDLSTFREVPLVDGDGDPAPAGNTCRISLERGESFGPPRFVTIGVYLDFALYSYEVYFGDPGEDPWTHTDRYTVGGPHPETITVAPWDCEDPPPTTTTSSSSSSSSSTSTTTAPPGCAVCVTVTGERPDGLGGWYEDTLSHKFVDVLPGFEACAETFDLGYSPTDPIEDGIDNVAITGISGNPNAFFDCGQWKRSTTSITATEIDPSASCGSETSTSTTTALPTTTSTTTAPPSCGGGPGACHWIGSLNPEILDGPLVWLIDDEITSCDSPCECAYPTTCPTYVGETTSTSCVTAGSEGTHPVCTTSTSTTTAPPTTTTTTTTSTTTAPP
jgi:hypothetical protein